MDITLKNGIRPGGRIKLPPSKSEAIRAALLFALAGEDPKRAAEGYEPPFCLDIERALTAAAFERPDAGESAALMRLLLPVMLVKCGEADIACSKRLLERGFSELEECFGTKAEFYENGVRMRCRPISRSRFTIDCSRSSQFLSGLLIALPLMPHECEIEIINGFVSKPYALMTLDLTRLFGGDIAGTETGFVTRPSRYEAPRGFAAAGDLSYAAVFEAMNLLGGDIEIEGRRGNTRQPDGAFTALAGLSECDITDCPDLLPLLAVTACARRGDAVIRGTRRLRTKESDREAGTVGLIRSLGGSAEIGEDSITIHGAGRLAGGTAGIQNDHRLAFAAAAAALICDSPVTVPNAQCVEKSAPQFWDDVFRLTNGGL